MDKIKFEVFRRNIECGDKISDEWGFEYIISEIHDDRVLFVYKNDKNELEEGWMYIKDIYPPLEETK